MSSTREWAAWYAARGWVPIPVGVKTKRAIERGWKSETLASAREKLDAWFPDGEPRNVGVLLGDASGGLIDVDLDCPETVALADEFLPPTLTFGRPSKTRSHRLYVSAEPGVPTEQLRDPVRGDGQAKMMLVELRACARGGGALQTVFPPSVHESGERIAFAGDPAHPPSLVEPAALRRAVRLLAAAALMAKHWPGEGARHEAALAWSGLLVRSGCSADETTLVVRSAAVAAGDEQPDDRERAARSSTEKAAGSDDRGDGQGEQPLLTGGPTLEGLGVPEAVVRAVKKWLCPRGADPADARFFDADGANPFTDLANGRRITARHADDLRYVVEWDKWLVWDETRWRTDPLGARRLAEGVAVSIGDEARAAEEAGNGAYGKLLRSWAKTSQSAASIRAALSLAQTQPGIGVHARDLDRDCWLLACPNGTLDLRTGELREPRREDLLTRLCATPYDPTARAPRWKQFVREIMDDDDDLTVFLQLAAGYSITGCVREHGFLLCYGTGRNGKSTILKTLQHVLGEEHACSVPSDLLLVSRGGGQHPTGQTTMYGKRLAVSLEPEGDRRLAEGLVKAITGGDKIVARRMREDFWEYEPRHTIWLATNHKPNIRGTDVGIWSKIWPIPFVRRYEASAGRPPDETLGERLREEAPGILVWLVEGALVYQKFPTELRRLPAKSESFKREYQAEQDRLGAFLDECVERAEGERVQSSLVWKVYVSHCREASDEPVSQTAFWRMLDERGFPSVRDKVARYRENLRLVGGTAAVARASLRVITGGAGGSDAGGRGSGGSGGGGAAPAGTAG